LVVVLFVVEEVLLLLFAESAEDTGFAETNDFIATML
jgi:hypothetical protein